MNDGIHIFIYSGHLAGMSKDDGQKIRPLSMRAFTSPPSTTAANYKFSPVS
ncbi:hypothetical protein LT85_4445 [Collimonas arenae]|uniref:Uncharacterized protein n=1 Tax=Collimonas arenae TaxID=279058 RepID=A0A0A1FFT4_9BURK|nr:hypothetical protein LT85_4445 [Collimonas arenae]